MSCSSPFSSASRTIWHEGSRREYHHYWEVRRKFVVESPEEGVLKITADAYYQAWVNGVSIGHGPSKSPAGVRRVDEYPISLSQGENVIEVLVLSMGVGSMTYCVGDAGVRFEIVGKNVQIGSDCHSEIRRAPGRLKQTVRRWILPGMEDFDARGEEGAWSPAVEVEDRTIYASRRVPLPRRAELLPLRKVREERVEHPNFQVGFRIKPALVPPDEVDQQESYDIPATFRLKLLSPCEQTLQLTPTLGSIHWSQRGKKVFSGSGWTLWKPTAEEKGTVSLSAGATEIEGVHQHNHFEHCCLAGFAEEPIEAAALEVIRGDGSVQTVEPLPFSNPHDLVVGARKVSHGGARRTIWDLGAVYCGWLAFDLDWAADADQEGDLLFAFFEAMDGERIQWADGCNNGLRYRAKPGRQSYESFFPYGVRYIVVDERGEGMLLSHLRILSATCVAEKEGYLETSEPLLGTIHEIAAQCVESGTDDTYTDCPTFEQVNWNFDNRLTFMADQYLARNEAINRNSLLLFAEDPHRTGLVPSQAPSAWLKRPIPNWSFSWLLWCWETAWATGDVAFAREVFPTVREGIEEAISRFGRSGLFEYAGVWHFVDWAPGRDDDHAINTSEQAALVGAMEAADKLAAFAGIEWSCAAEREGLKKAIRSHLWIPERNAFADSLHEDGTPSPVSSLISNAMMALYGIGSSEWSEALTREAARGESKLLPIGSPFGLFYTMELFDRYGETEALFREIRRRWGDMVKAGDRTTWETFAEFSHGDWPTRSRCHPVSSYVIKYLVKYLLGVEALEPGMQRLRIKPRPPEGVAWCRGGIPVGEGVLSISWSRSGNELVKPEEIELTLPPSFKREQICFE